MSAWLWVQVAEPVRGRIARAMVQSCFWPRPDLSSTWGANTRFSTRATFVSTSSARRSYANELTAPAV